MKNGNMAIRAEAMAMPEMTQDEPQLLPHQKELIRKQELLAKVRAGYHKTDRSKFGAVLEGDPKMHYAWINNRADVRVNFEGVGYEICRDPKVVTRFKREDGTHVRGDLILMQVDKEVYEMLQWQDDYASIEKLEDPSDRIAAEAARMARTN